VIIVVREKLFWLGSFSLFMAQRAWIHEPGPFFFDVAA
jgi:hypothetical protein